MEHDSATAYATPAPVTVFSPDPSRLPNVEQLPRRVEREPFVSEGAEYEVLHMIVGGGDPESPRSFDAGDRIRASDLGENIDIDRLLRLEALRPLAGKGDN